jgi:hypothetical protein
MIFLWALLAGFMTGLTDGLVRSRYWRWLIT